MKIKYILLSIIALIVLIGIGYVVFQISSDYNTTTTNNVPEQPKPQDNIGNEVTGTPSTPIDEEEEWIEFISEELGIKFKYPKNLILGDSGKYVRLQTANNEEEIVIDIEKTSSNVSNLVRVKSGEIFSPVIEGEQYTFENKTIVGEGAYEAHVYLLTLKKDSIRISLWVTKKSEEGYPKTGSKELEYAKKTIESIKYL